MNAALPAQTGIPVVATRRALPADVDVAIRAIAAEARRSLPVERVILFGSRARGDFRPDSDIDLAVEHRGDDAAWASFVNIQSDLAPTLLRLDLVDLRAAQPSLRERILSEGRVIE